MKKKIILFCICITMISTLMLGCAKKEESPIVDNDNQEDQEPSTDIVKEPAIMIYNAGGDPPTLDPQLNTKSEATLINLNLFEGLVKMDGDGKIIPAVAETWDISDDGLVYTFHLNKDAKWSDGQAVTASDFDYSWKRALNPENAVKSVNYMFYLKNAEAAYKGEKDADEIGLKVIDEYTFEVTLESPVPYIMELYSYGVYNPVRKDIVEANPDRWTLSPETCVSNGPFKMSSFKMNEKIILVKDENYWNSKNKGKLDELHFVFIEDSSTALKAYEAGEIDGLGSIPSEEIQRLMMEGDELKVVPKLSTTYFAYNVGKSPLDNAKVREALTLAIDKEVIVKAFPQGLYVPATGFVSVALTLEGNNFREIGDKNGPVIPRSGDVEKAKLALAEAGYPDGNGFPEVEYLYNTNDSNKKIAEILQEMWKQNLNIDISLVNVESKVSSERRHNGQFQIARAGWGADFNHPMSFLDLFTSDAGNNTPQYRNPEYDNLIREAKQALDPDDIIELLHKAEDMILSDYAICPLFYSNNLALTKDKFKDVKFSSLGHTLFDEVYVE